MAVFIELGEKSKNVPKDRRKSFPPPFFSGKAFYQTCPAICVVTGTKIQKQKQKLQTHPLEREMVFMELAC